MNEADRPGEQEGRFEVEDDEQDRDQVEAHVELGAAVLEGGKAAFIFAELSGRAWCAPVSRDDQHRQHDEAARQRQRDGEEQQDRQIIGGDGRQGKLQGLENLAAL